MGNLFDRARLIGTPPPRPLALETRRRNQIENEPGLNAVAPGQRMKFTAMVAKFSWIERKPPSGAYNCAGHVWASRRTAIYEPATWDMIIRDDGYRKLDAREAPFPGDLVFYRRRDNGEILHVAEVVEIRSIVSGQGSGVPWILSKLDATSGEVLHAVENVPYTEQGFPYRCEFYTERPTR